MNLPLTTPADESPERLARHGELVLMARASLSVLKGRQRALVSLRYVDGLTLAAIAERFGVGVPAVHAMHRRALVQMRKALASRGIHALHEVI